MRICYIAPAITHVTIEPNLQECLLLLCWISGHVNSIYIQPVCMSVLHSPYQMPRHHCHRVSRHITLRIFYYVAIDQHTCLKPRSYVCNSFTRLAGMLQCPCFKGCFEPACMSVRVASTSRYV